MLLAEFRTYSVLVQNYTKSRFIKPEHTSEIIASWNFEVQKEQRVCNIKGTAIMKLSIIIQCQKIPEGVHLTLCFWTRNVRKTKSLKKNFQTILPSKKSHSAKKSRSRPSRLVKNLFRLFSVPHRPSPPNTNIYFWGSFLFFPHHQIFFLKISENLITNRLGYKQESFSFKFVLRVTVYDSDTNFVHTFSLCSYAFLLKKSTASCFESSIYTYYEHDYSQNV